MPRGPGWTFFSKISRTVLFLAALLIMALKWKKPRSLKTAEGEKYCDLTVLAVCSAQGVVCLCSNDPE